MNRLEKKCLLGSAAMHTLLVVIFLFGSAFLPKRAKNDTPVVLEMVPYNALKFTDGPSTGGNPNVAPPPAPAPAPKPIVQPPAPPPPQPKPEKPVETVKPKEPVHPKEPDPKQVGDVPERVKPKASQRDPASLTNKVVKLPSAEMAKARAEQEAREQAARAAADQARRFQALAGKFDQAASGLNHSLSGKVPSSVEAYGPGGGGPAVANWRAAVVDFYKRAWDRDRPPDAGGSANVKTKITISRDGTVLNWLITRPSGDSALDDSVKRLLQAVKSVPPFPDGAVEDQRVLNISFDLNLNHTS